MKEFEWYVNISNSDNLSQGDFIIDCPIIKPPKEIDLEGENDIQVDLINSIVLSQSCDLLNNKIEIVLVCPFFPLQYFVDNLPEDQKGKKALKKVIDTLRKGNQPGYHLLNKSEEFGIDDYIVVDFRNVYGIHIENLKKIIERKKSRIRLSPPYREHLSQAFARYFMRVGLPQDINIEGYY
jgi:hypothetical protein